MSYPTIDLTGAHVVVTGGAQGIGRCTAERFAAQGARVSIGDLDLDRAREAAAVFGGFAGRLDVASKASYAAFLDAARAVHGPVDVLVNNAGIMPNGAFHELDDDLDRATLDVNVFGVVHGMKLVLPDMLPRGRGHIVNVASLAGKFPIKGLAVYNASKYAVVGLSAATRLEYAAHGISISAVLPSAVDTALASGLDMRPIPKVKPEQIADAVVGTVRSRAAEVAVPSYVGLLANTAVLTPEPVMRGIRRLIRDDRALRPDAPDRQAYRARLARDTHQEI